MHQCPATAEVTPQFSELMKVMLELCGYDPGLVEANLAEAHRLLGDRHLASAANAEKSKKRRPGGRPKNDPMVGLALMLAIDGMVRDGEAPSANQAIEMLIRRFRKMAPRISDLELRAQVVKLATRNALWKRYQAAKKEAVGPRTSIAEMVLAHLEADAVPDASAPARVCENLGG